LPFKVVDFILKSTTFQSHYRFSADISYFVQNLETLLGLGCRS